jgi:signal recognition particle subunit SRP54
MDAALGQAAHDQALAFKNKVNVGAVVITKLDGHAKGGGALSAYVPLSHHIIIIIMTHHIISQFLSMINKY